MEEYWVLFNDMKEVEKFVNIVSKLPFNMDIGSGTVVMDAKSIQGVMALGLGKKNKLTVHGSLTDETKKELQDILQTGDN